jgi:hypothetical protein
VLIVAGLQEPVIAGVLLELAGNRGAVEFRHSGPIGANVGIICGSTVIIKVAVVAHWPAVGVNV